VLATLLSIYLYRVQRITRTLEIRFEERTRERTRIARDLHDSLLQGIQGLMLKFHALARTMPERSPARIGIEGNLRQARELVEGVRTRVGELRKQDEPKAKLEELLRDFGGKLPASSSRACEISVVGEARPLDPIAFEEVLFVGREAISNAMLHAEATRIEVELTYRTKELLLRVSDDGKGVDSNTLESGRAGHWGLQGMRERAGSLGAVLELWSRPGVGTDVQLVVPGAVAYGRQRPRKDESLLKRLTRVIFTGRSSS
jgi:signal transduction histidine kinase